MTTRAAAIVVLASTLSWPAMSASLWQHNGSIVSLEASGTARKFSYETPRPGLNVSPGALLFDGVKNGDTYSGTAFEFSRSCPPAGYQVSGSVSSNQQVVTMTGDAPVRDTACKIVGSKPSDLVFTYVRTAPFASADDVKSKPRDQSVSVTPKAVEQDGAGDSAQQDQCQLPKEANYVFFDTSGFAVRTSASNQDDKNIAFQIHSVEIDDPARASVEYFAVEHITPAESNWIIQIHVDDNLEYVFVPVKRLWELRFTATENDFSKAESNVEEYRSLPFTPMTSAQYHVFSRFGRTEFSKFYLSLCKNSRATIFQWRENFFITYYV